MAVKLCECGCLQETRLYRGKPRRFVHGHNYRGKSRPSHSATHRAKIGASRKGKVQGVSHPKWKGDRPRYNAVHAYLNRKFPKTGKCDECKRPKRTQYALITGRVYSRNREDYRELCSSCHVRYDDAARGGRRR
jgi:hypothetical protein